MQQLATHPDATVVKEANRNLRLLEQMRATLTDTNRRAAYDAGIGVGSAGGLANPAAILRKATPATAATRDHPPSLRPVPPPRPMRPRGACECPKCHTRKPEWTQFCLNCQNELMRLCPECSQIGRWSKRAFVATAASRSMRQSGAWL